VTWASIATAAQASTASVTATASPQDTARTGNPSAHARQVTTGTCRRAFSPVYSAMPAAQVTPLAAASCIAVMASARINAAPVGEPAPWQHHARPGTTGPYFQSAGPAAHDDPGPARDIRRPPPERVRQAEHRDTTCHLLRCHEADRGTPELGGLLARFHAVVAAVRPPRTRNTPVRTRRDPALVQTHGDLPASPEHVPRPSTAAVGDSRCRNYSTSSATSLDAHLALALTPALHPGSRPSRASADGTTN
jgi:hypothetical protein